MTFHPIISIITEVKSSTRERLLEAAARVIARDGFQGARLADVAREAGLTTGAVYSNFRDKEELFMAAFEQMQRPGGELPTASGIDDLVAIFRAEASQFDNSRQLQVLNLEGALLGARDARVRAWLREGAQMTIDALAKEFGGDEDESRERAALLVALANGVALMRVIAPDQLSIDAAERGLRRLAGEQVPDQR